MSLDSAYELQERHSEDGHKFFFISEGDQNVLKVVQYNLVEEVDGKKIYNLGFGDYNFANNTIADSASTNNGDAYKVFNTVLSTIPIFFSNYNDHILMVQGSDSRTDFIRHCKRVCRKKCKEDCKNHNRRIKIYQNYLDKNYENLSKDYHFIGATKKDDQLMAVEYYQPYKKYDSVFLFQNKNVLSYHEN
ncbi:DUF6934 family protein [Pinibacter aurantiacus]|uniref:Uncharacterized protein n=1 Tax=Pinibacter aurantiacus TaxID=2851599 RepID=A0A9E2SCS4_9BACT|nr:hypothetical protein [Pinibacter aurantiacus]MBV4360251.1 hypothetical protein [Pinibacter aurantiacus]